MFVVSLSTHLCKVSSKSKYMTSGTYCYQTIFLRSPIWTTLSCHVYMTAFAVAVIIYIYNLYNVQIGLLARNGHGDNVTERGLSYSPAKCMLRYATCCLSQWIPCSRCIRFQGSHTSGSLVTAFYVIRGFPTSGFAIHSPLKRIDLGW